MSGPYQPPFESLPGVPGCRYARWVGTTMMTERQYLDEGWHIDPVGGFDYWRATWSGLMGRSQDRAGRIEAARDRDEEDQASWGAFHSPPRGYRSPSGTER